MPTLPPHWKTGGGPSGGWGYGGADPHVNGSIDHVPGLEPVGAATRGPDRGCGAARSSGANLFLKHFSE